MNHSVPTRLSASCALLALLSSPSWAQETLREVQAPQVGHSAVASEEVDTEPWAGDRVLEWGPGFVETMDQAMRRIALQESAPPLNRRERNGRPGSWSVPGVRKNQTPHSGVHYVYNKWGDTRMGIGFGAAVRLEGAWIAAVGNRGSWAPGLQVIGYLDGQAVAATDWFTDVDGTSSWFDMDMPVVDRVEILARPANGGAGWYGLDDLTFVDLDSGLRVVVDFEDLSYEDDLTGTGYAGLTWEHGTGQFDETPGPRAVTPPQAPAGSGVGGNGPVTGGPGASAGAGAFGGGGTTYAAGGTLPVLLQNFEGPKMFDTGANAFPPDTCGSVGINHFVAVVNSNLSVYEKSTGSRVVNVSLAGFFVTSSVGDPRVVFDPDSQRFIVLVTNFNNRIFLAVSTTSDPTGAWFKTWWNPADGSDAGKWPDYPTLGVDQRGIYVGAYMVPSSMTLFAIDKAPLVAATQSMGTVTAFRGLIWEGAIQPCVAFQDAGQAYAVSVNGTSKIRVRTVIPPLTAPTTSSQLITLSQSFSPPPDAPAKGSNTNLDTVGTRLMNAVYTQGSIWTAHTVKKNSRAVSRWYELDPTAGSEVQQGTVRDSQGQGRHYFFPSVAVNPLGHVVLGGSVSSDAQWAGCFYTGRLASDNSGQMAFPFEYRTGLGNYNHVDGSGRNRWGDYSLTSVDPVDGTVWTIQEHSLSGNKWGTNIAQLGFNSPCDANITRYCAPSSLGPQIDVNTCSLSSGSIQFTYSGGTPGQFGYLLVGSGTGVINNPPGAQGDLCLGGGAIGRYTSDLGVIDASGQFTTDVINGNTGGGVGNLPGTLGGTITPGSTWNWQFWARHQGVPSTFSDALSVTFIN